MRLYCALLTGVILSAVLLSSISSAQIRRHALVQLETSQTCRPCVFAMDRIDIAKRRLGDSLIVIEYELGGLPVPGERGFEGPIAGTFMSYYGIWEVPALVFGLRDFIPYPWAYYSSDSLWVLESVTSDLLKPPIVDFRIVNAAYDPATQILSADLDVFPLDTNSLPAEDTCDYVTMAVVTEEDVALVHYVGAVTDSNFHEHAVARALADDSACGTRFVFGTRSPEGPHLYRRHLAIELLDDINHDQLRLKGVVGIASHHSTNRYAAHASLEYLDANQSDFINKLPDHAPDSLWILYPRMSTRYPKSGVYRLDWSGSELGIPVSLDATTDSGLTWIHIATISANSFKWVIPSNLAGQTVQVRVSRVDKPAVVARTLSFRVDADGAVPHVTVLRPGLGEVVRAGTVYQIQLDVEEYGPVRTIQFSSDAGSHWSTIGTTASNVLLWNVPFLNAQQALLRVVSGPVMDTSNTFSIAKPLGSIEQLSIDRYPNVLATHNAKVLWFNNNYVGDTLTVSYSLDSGQSWSAIGRAPVRESDWQWMTWSVPDTTTNHAMLAVQTDKGIFSHTDLFSIIAPLSVLDAESAYNPLHILESPVQERMTIELAEEPYQVSIFDVTGRLVLEQNKIQRTEQGIVIGTTQLPAGLYMVTISTGSGSKQGLFIKN